MEGYSTYCVLAVLIVSTLDINLCAGDVIVKVTEGDTATLSCNHGRTGSVQAIMWTVERGQSITVATKYQNGDLKVTRQDMAGRVEISYPSGDLKISDVRRTDGKDFNCIVITGGSPHDSGWTTLKVLVPPMQPSIKCTASDSTEPAEDCSAIKEDQIMGMRCSTESSPPSDIFWLEYNNCSIQVDNLQDQALDYNIVRSGIVLRNLCAGSYCCYAVYKGADGSITRSKDTCQTVARKSKITSGPSAPNTASPITSVTDWKLYTYIAGGIIVFLLIVLAVVLICCCRYKRKHDRYPEFCHIPGPKTKKKNVKVMVDVNGDGDPETMALTPFLGPNSVRKDEPVFNFVINQANEDPNVDRVRVMQDIEPGGEKSRTVEIYKKKDSFLQPDFNVPPSIFRRALSNSDVSKIVYKESVDEDGRTKRELDIIKNEDRDADLESRHDLRPASGATGSSMYNRQLSIHPSSSENDVRRVRFQRQDTIMGSPGSGGDQDEVDGFIYLPRASEVGRRQLSYQNSVSVDIDDVD